MIRAVLGVPFPFPYAAFIRLIVLFFFTPNLRSPSHQTIILDHLDAHARRIHFCSHRMFPTVPRLLTSWPAEKRQQCGQLKIVHAGGGTLVSFSARAGIPYELLLTRIPSPGHTRANVQSLSAVTSNIPPFQHQLIIRFLTITGSC